MCRRYLNNFHFCFIYIGPCSWAHLAQYPARSTWFGLSHRSQPTESVNSIHSAPSFSHVGSFLTFYLSGVVVSPPSPRNHGRLWPPWTLPSVVLEAHPSVTPSYLIRSV